MCLDARGIKKIDDPTTLIEGGWKYFRGVSSNPEFPHNTWKGNKDCPLDKWIIATGVVVGGLYPAGFHVFTDEAKAKQLNDPVRRVYFRRVTSSGIDQGMATVVAQEIYVPSLQEDWPPMENGKG